MSTRRSHTKSRTGCRDCKRRKVKCDEVYPTCFNCSRHGITCSLSISRSDTDDISPRRPPTTASSVPSPIPTANPEPLDLVIDRAPCLLQPAPAIDFWGRGLELMHHYTLATANTLALRGDMQHVWRVIVPEVGYRCPFLMHGILTIAALHKASLVPFEKEAYIDLATSHQNTGLEGFRAALSSIDDTNWEFFFCFASMVVFYVCSLPVRLRNDIDQTPHVLDLFTFVRGIRAVLEPFQLRLIRTKFAALAYGVWIVDKQDANYRNPAMQYSPLPSDIFQALETVSIFFRDTFEGETRDEYVKAVEELGNAVYLMAHAGADIEVGMLLFWPYVIPDNIMADIQAQNPYAVVLLSYFAIPLSVLEQRFWFLKGWSRRLFALVDVCLEGHLDLLDMVKWPRQQVFEVRRPS